MKIDEDGTSFLEVVLLGFIGGAIALMTITVLGTVVSAIVKIILGV